MDTLIYMYNGHADVTALFDTSNNVVANYYYDAFGNLLESTGSVNNNILYAGYQYDKETGLYYLNARMYDPVTARFLQVDTYTGQYNDPLSLNLYTYCKNDPMIYSDPTGHSWWSSFTSWVGGAVSSLGKAVSNAVSATASTVENVASTVVSATASFLNDPVGTVQKAASAAVNTEAAVAVSAAAAAANTDAGKAIVNKAVQISNSVAGACKSAINVAGKALSSVGKFCYDNRVAIGIGALAVGSVVLGVVTLGASVPVELALASTIAGSALIGGGIGLGIKEASDLADNGKIDSSAKQYIGAYLGGAVAGALAPVAAGGESAAAIAVMNGTGAMAGDMTQQLIGAGKINPGEAIVAGVTGGVLSYGLSNLSGLAGGIEGAVSNAADYLKSTNLRDMLADQTGSINLGAFTGGAKGVTDVATKTPIQQYSITTYEDFVDRSVVGDNLEAHEIWQHANLKANGLATNRLSTEASKNNPVIALDREQHIAINKAQKGIDALNQSPEENILANSVLLSNAGISENIVNEATDKALIHLRNTLK